MQSLEEMNLNMYHNNIQSKGIQNLGIGIEKLTKLKKLKLFLEGNNI